MFDIEVTQEMIDKFREVMPAFADIIKWPDEVVSMALCEALCEAGGRGWGELDLNDCRNFKRRGVFFYAAHWLSITYTSGAGATDPGNIDPSARLNLSGKSVGDESITYRITAIEGTGDDFLSLTLYGVQYSRMRRRSAMGARAV
ncbi:MAG: DUF4054 domain-containing protein [Shewanella sp.]